MRYLVALFVDLVVDLERRQVLAAIGPFWDGNEVWLLALGGVLFVAFPAVLASGLSGFYFAIFLVLLLPLLPFALVGLFIWAIVRASRPAYVLRN